LTRDEFWFLKALRAAGEDTSICIVDDTGKIVREVKVASEPDALLQVLRNPAYRFRRIGLEAGPLSQWLFSALAEAGLPVICVETRHMRAVLKAQINKTDRNDARGIAQMMRAGLYRPVHVKTLRSQKLRMLLVHRKPLQSKSIAIENDPKRGHGAGLIDCTVYELPEPLRVKRTLSPTFTFERSTDGTTGNSIFIAGHLISGMGP
jgi:hypothetical protein